MASLAPSLYIGLMSGTSLDGVDGVLVDFDDWVATGKVRVLAHRSRPFDSAHAAELLALNSPDGSDELHRAALQANALARLSAQVVADLLQASKTGPDAVCAIGSHGQTVRHRPREFDGVGYTLQLNAPALLAELTGIDVIADFRSRDLAAGGIGAPLVPAFHRAVFGRAGESGAVLNIGGMANLSALHSDGSVTGWDCGPGNVLLDLWCRARTGQPYDAQGSWAASGHVIEDLLATMLAEPYFALPAPKSTGRDLFHAGWLDAHLNCRPAAGARDVQATLSALTASVCARDVLKHAPPSGALLVCGGGALNLDLMRRLQVALPQHSVQATDARGLPAMQVEACAFAWLAKAFVDRKPGNVCAVTGASGPRILGALYPAS
ncbi:MAG: anhydro-N-acetylmuramic acid kinase [Burkholderiaceae bacterium]